jgi:uncharacterized membrane protein (UPF0127 family)
MLKKNIFKVSLGLALFLVLGGLFWLGNQKSATINGQKFQLEIADNDEARSLGLGERDSLCETCAMLFVFPQEAQYSFWMKGMRFSLDIIWFKNKDGKIVKIEKNIPADSRETFSPSENADRVLEVNGGWADRLDLKVGDIIQN